MKTQVWVISQNGEDVVLATRVHLAGRIIMASQFGCEQAVNIGEYKDQHEAKEAIRDQIKWLQEDNNSNIYKMKPAGFDAN